MACNNDIDPMAAVIQGKPPVLRETDRNRKKAEERGIMRNKEKYLSALLTSDTLKEAAEKAMAEYR